MKRKLLLMAAVVLGFLSCTMAQSPQLMNYQAVVRNAQGQPLTANLNVTVRFSIHQGTTGGSVVFQETATAVTNQFGLISLQIGGNGSNLSTVNWANGPFYLQVEADPAGGSNFTDMGTSQLISVPYALYAANSGNGPVGATGPQGVQGNQGPAGATGLQGIAGPTGVAGGPGAVGPTGSAGSNGATGPAGPSGLDGTNGVTGATGPSGQDGVDGATGASGQDGVDGATGATGASGQDGVDGVTGATGPSGQDGLNGGATGATGATGPSGQDGVDGITGATGPSGQDGVDGATGATGADGPSGQDGIDGVTGATGPSGQDGMDGVTGATGATGPSGQDGMDGATGATGPSGGPVGPTGPSGQDGTDGVTGATGPSGGPVGPTGPSGQDGTDGTTGATGPSGQDGTDGVTGATGPSGQDGTDGVTGATGPSGQDGTDGVTGATGPSGQDGTDGVTGATGPSGQDGTDGVTGATGPSGQDGVDGVTGATGPSGGPVGPTGPSGQDGTDGVTGATGPSGQDGMDGATGATGATGPSGQDGVDGVTGATGPSGGPVGPTGPSGQDGTDGVTGATGPSGQDGTDGVTGATGATGPSGQDGTDGVTGATGPSGQDGASGASGPSGQDGVTGATGPSGSATVVGGTGITINTDTINSYWNSPDGGVTLYNLNSGNTGIGTSAPQAFFEVSGGVNDVVKVTSTTGGSGNHAYIDFNTYSGTGVNARIGSIDMGDYDGSLVFETNSNQTNNSTGTSEVMRITDGGQVGIGTTAPAYPLEVDAVAFDLVNINNTADALAGLLITSASNPFQTSLFNSFNTGTLPTNTFWIANDGAGARTDLVIEPTNGYVGMGAEFEVVSPVNQLHVYTANAAINAIFADNESNVGGLDWGPGDNYAGVSGQSGAGSAVSFMSGIYGYDIGTGPNTGGVVGAYTSSIWGALGYVDPGGSIYWGVYSSGPASIQGTLQIQDGTQAAGSVFTSDGNGNGSWQSLSSVLTAGTGITIVGNTINSYWNSPDGGVTLYSLNTAFTGIGATVPLLPLEVGGASNGGFAFVFADGGANANNGFAIGNSGTDQSYIYNDQAGIDGNTFGSLVISNTNFGRPDVVIDPTNGYVGIGNGTPNTGLDLVGAARINDGTAAQGAVLTAVDNTGLATWSLLPSTNTGFLANTSSVSVSDNTLTTIPYSNVVFDDGSNYNSSTGIYTAPSGGVYHFDASVIYESFSVPGAPADIRLYVNGTLVSGNTSDSYNVFNVSLSTDIKLASGDQVQVEVINETGSSETEGNSAAGYNSFSGHRVY